MKTNNRYRVKMFISDMGSFTTSAQGSYSETAEENALWSVNSARRHDGLPELTLAQFQNQIRLGNVKFTLAN